jgi:hypothetical protein
MNAYPSWTHRIPEMIEILALAGAERIDRQAAERRQAIHHRVEATRPEHPR